MFRERISLGRVALLLVIGLSTCAVAVVMLRRFLENRMLYYPDRSIALTPAARGLAFTEVELRASDGTRLVSWHVHAPDPHGLVLHFHGNAGNISDRLPYAAAFADSGLDTLLMDYRGYGRSEGEPSEEGLYLDADAAYVWAEARGLPVIAYGESLGGAVAIDLAARRAVAGLVAQSTFTTLREMASRVVPFGGALATQRFDSLVKIEGVNAPILIVHGEADELVPHAMGARLFQAARDPKSMLSLPGVGHNEVMEAAGPEVARRTAALLPGRSGER